MSSKNKGISYGVSATQTKNFLLDEPLLDWLDIYGNSQNIFPNQVDNKLFPNFLMNKGIQFEQYVVQLLESKHPIYKLPDNINFTKRNSKTIKAMEEGKLIIYQGGIFHPELKIYGIPDLLVRSDYLNHIIIDPILSNQDINIPCKYSQNWHYRVIDIKFSTLYLSSDAQHLLNNKMTIVYKGQLTIYNECLGYTQQYKPNNAYILGRKWQYQNNNTTYSGFNCLEKLGLVNFEKESNIIKKTFEAINWIQELRKNGHIWTIQPPSIKELYPNLSNKYDYPWHNIKKIIAQQIGDITLLWQCGVKERNYSHNTGIQRWDNIIDPSINLNVFGKKAKIIDNIITTNKNNDIKLSPRRIKNWNCLQKIKPTQLYFICDFETTNDLNTEFNHSSNGTIIFMIGCITVYYNQYGIQERDFQSFTCNQLSHQQEFYIINEWINYMNTYAQIFKIDNPIIYHWSKAEPSLYNHALNKYNCQYIWGSLNYIDVLDIFKEEPITVKGAFSYNLKDISRALYNNKLINTLWDNQDIDGQEAMIYAWQWNTDSQNNMDIIHKIQKYNYIDCKVIDDILELLRTRT